MREEATGRLYGRGAVATRLGPIDRIHGGLFLGGLLSFLALPSPLGVVLTLVAFAVLAAVAPFGALLSLLGAVPLHFTLRRPFIGPLELSLPDAVLLACVLGLLGRVYWRALLRGSGELKSPLRRMLRSPYFLPGLLLVAISTLTLVLLPPQTSRGLVVGLRAYSIIIEPLAVYALVLLGLRGRRDRLWLLLDVVVAGALVVSLYGVLEALWVAVNPSPQVGGYYRISSFFNHPNSLALYLTRTLSIFGALAVALPAGERRRRVYLAGVALMGAAMLLSGSRGGWIAVAAAAVPIALLSRSYRWLVLAGAAGAVGIGFLLLTGLDRLSSLFRPGRNSADTRERIWKAAIEEIERSPLWGTGLGHVEWMHRYVGRRRLRGTELIDAHNLFLDFWSKLGIIGLLAILGLVARFYLLALQAYRRGEAMTRALAVALIAAMTGSIVHGLVDAFYFGLPLAVFFWLMLGLAEVLSSEI
ncbi:MAG: O-antigen ligase family protein [Chloroflexota bacterium]|nr:O-antigen ligase family protein [Chloroflexota bacterium]